ncbi:MAG: energy transducer TonB [Flavobacteriales bacterium]|nr:energy transducer TonB [Flavobacteriales bacterium]
MRSVITVLALFLMCVLRAQGDSTTASPVTSYGDTCFTTCEVMPVYPGGEAAFYAFMKKELRYPTEARDEWIEGKVWVTFVLEKDGSVSQVKVFRSVHPLLDAEAVRVVSAMEHWTPGYQFGKPVRVKYNLPITFTMPGKPPKRILKRRAELGW